MAGKLLCRELTSLPQGLARPVSVSRGDLAPKTTLTKLTSSAFCPALPRTLRISHGRGQRPARQDSRLRAVLSPPLKETGREDEDKAKQTRTMTEDEQDAVELQALKQLKAAAAADPEKPPLQLVESHVVADGILDIVRWEGDQMLRIWKPAGWNPTDEPNGYPVLYLNDGQNLFTDNHSISGQGWRAADTASALIASGKVPAFVMVGIDNSGVLRSYDYTPYKPGTGPLGVRKDAEKWLGGGVNEYLDRVVEEVIPFVSEKYFLSREPQKMAFGGSSFGGICALACGIRHPTVFGALLVESPSLWLANEKFLREDLASYEGPWPERTFLAMGSKEYSFTRKNDPQPEFDELLTTYIPKMVEILEKNGVAGEDRVKGIVEAGAGHTESAWERRLPGALEFLLTPWWKAAAAGRNDYLYFTSPKRPHAGKPAALFFNKAKSEVVRDTPGAPWVNCGFNEWSVDGAQELQMAPAPWLGLEGGDWWVASIKVPAIAYEMNFVFGDAERTVWDNNGGNNFYHRVRPLNLSQLAGTAAGPQLTVDQLAEHNRSKLYFTYPSHLIAGGPVQIFCNRAKSGVLQHSPNVNVHYGFNDWSEGVGTRNLKPTSLWRGEGIDFWSTEPFEIPEGCSEMNFAFNDGGGAWESNGGDNFRVNVKDLKKLEGKVNLVKARTIDHVDSHDLAWGRMNVITLGKREGKDTAKTKWTEEKRIRVWTPPGYDKEKPPPGGWPILYLQDGQNMFEDWLAHQGVSWRAADTASELIRTGQLPPFLICAVDNAGPMRSLNFLPYVPGTGVGGFRGDCERWPGGGVGAYLNRLVDEVIPLVVSEYNVSTDPFRVAFGGGSFAGVAALYAAMHFPHVFGSILCESPSIWIAEGRFLGDMAGHSGMLPERIFIGCGTKEYSATRDHDRDDVDALLLHYYHEAARILQDKGMRGPRMKFLVEEGAGHHETAWQWRLTGAMQYLFSPWWN